VLAGIVLAAMTLSPAQQGFAQAPSCLPPTATSTPSLGVIIQGITQQPTATCTPTPPQIVRTATPTFTVTPAATNTSAPATQAPVTNTPVPPAPSATSPSGAPAGAAIQPPNTGSGPSGAGPSVLPLLMGAVALMVAGGGTLAVAARRRK